MVPISSVFGERGPETSDNGYLHTLTDGNMAADGVTTFTGSELGVVGDMFNGDNSTYAGAGRSGTASEWTDYITIDILKKIRDAVITIYFSALQGGSSQAVTVKLQTSEDNSTWTDRHTLSRNTAGETFKNYSAQHTFRYLRLEVAKTGTGSSEISGRFYSVRVSKK